MSKRAWSCLVFSVLGWGCDAEAPPRESAGEAESALLCGSVTSAANTVEIKFAIPPALTSAAYTGDIPVTFGIPFPEGELDADAFLGVYQTGTPNCGRPAQFQISARWGERGEETTVKWLLVDTVVSMLYGQIAPTYLQFDNALPAASPGSFPWSTGYAARIAESGGAPTSISADALGEFKLTVDGRGTYVAGMGSSGVEIETPHPGGGSAVRTVLKVRGNYVQGGSRIGEHFTRYTLYADQPYVRIHHTMVWGRDNDPVAPSDEGGINYDTEQIEHLAYDVPSFGAAAACTGTSVGIEGASPQTSSCTDGRFRQKSETEIDKTVGVTTTTLTPAGLAGWLRIDKTAADDVFVGLRWAMEQYPSGFKMSAGPVAQVRLLDAAPLTWKQMATNTLTAGAWIDTPASNVYPHSPLGVGKTYELLVWPGGAPAPEVQNAFAQGGVFAYADPTFTVRAGIPAIMTARTDDYPRSLDEATATPVETIENALANAFSFVTRKSFTPGASPPDISRLGALNFGDQFYSWRASSPNVDRFWANTGSASSVLSWVLWMRSGDAGYRQFAEANARHLMDVDTNQVRRKRLFPGSAATFWSFRGGQDSYASQHGAFHTGLNEPWHFYTNKTSEVEGIAAAYFMTGYERARDVLRDRAQAIVDADIIDLIVDGHTGSGAYGGSQGPVIAYQFLGDLARLEEVVGDDVPLSAGVDAMVDAVLGIQDLGSEGWYVGAQRRKLESGLVVAARVLPDRREEIAASLAAWDRFNGSRALPGPTGKVDGTRSVLATLANYDETGDERVLDGARGMAYAQAKTVHDDATATGLGAHWIGSSNIDEDFLADVGLDWLALLARGTSFTPHLPSVSYLSRITNADPLNMNRYESYSRFYALKDAGEELQVLFDFGMGGTQTERPVVVAVTNPSGASLSPTTYCVRDDFLRFREVVTGTTDTDNDCPGANPSVSSESFFHSIAGTELGVAGTYRIDLEQGMDVGDSFPVMPAAEAFRIRSQTNRYLSFTGGAVAFANDADLLGRDKMTVAVRAQTSGAGLQMLVDQGDQFSIWSDSGFIFTSYKLSQGMSTITKTTSVAAPSPWTSLQPFVSSLHIDDLTGEVVVRLCGPSGCSTTVGNHPGYGLAPGNPSGSLTIGRNAAGSFALVGGIDDVRILPRVATEREIADYIVGNGRWDVAERDIAAGGEVFLFDGDLDALSGAARSTTSASGFTFASRSPQTRIARDAELVQYDPAHDLRDYEDEPSHTCCSTRSDGQYTCSIWSPQIAYAGILVGRREAPFELYTCESVGHPSRFGLVDDDGKYLASSAIATAVAPARLCTDENALDLPAGTLQTFLTTTVGMGDSSKQFGLGPLLAARKAQWFDALSCEDHSRVVEFGASDFIELPDFNLADTNTISFKMRAPAALPPPAPASYYLLNKTYEFRAYTYNGRIYVDHYLFGASSLISVSAPYPADQWVTVTATVTADSGNVTATMYLNGVRASRSTVPASGFNRNAFTLKVGRGETGGSEVSYNGLLDDLWIRNGIDEPAIQKTWATCGAGTGSGHVFMPFEECGTNIVDRLTGAPATCTGGPLCTP